MESEYVNERWTGLGLCVSVWEREMMKTTNYMSGMYRHLRIKSLVITRKEIKYQNFYVKFTLTVLGLQMLLIVMPILQ